MSVRVQIHKRTVEEFRIGSQTFSKEQAEQIHQDLSVALGKPQFTYGDCGNAYSHGPHLDGTTTFCRGRAFDRT